jgi:hypothetical protein
MFKISNVLPIIFVGIIRSNIQNKTIKIVWEKIVLGLLATASIIIFNIFNPKSRNKEEKNH